MLKEFKEFAMRGNVLDMAIGVIMGSAFGKVVSSMVADIIMPPIGKLMGGVDFAILFINLGEGQYASLSAAKDAGAATLNYGLFINTILDFLIVALVIFILVKQLNRFKKASTAPEPSVQEKLLTEIRDLLKK